jgi:thiamine pyrophosphate-dependent acetolactate synthase large subunit-like protein
MNWSIAVVLALPLAVMAQAPAPAKNSTRAPTSKEAEHRNEDVARHRQMARAHEEAARCLEGGAPEKQCQEQLREMCKGIAVGQYCGMRHGH